MPLASYTQRELRYRSLGNTNPAEAERLGALAQEAVSGWTPSRWLPAARSIFPAEATEGS